MHFEPAVLVGVVYMSICNILTSLSIFCACAGALGLSDAEEAIDYPSVVDLGELRQGQAVALDIPMINRTDAPLVVQRVAGSCGCILVGGVHNIELAAGGSGHVELQLDTTANSGKLNSSIMIFLVGFGRPLTVRLEGTISAEYPRHVDFGSLNPRKIEDEVVSIMRYRGQPELEIVGLEYNKSHLDVRWDSIDSDTARIFIRPNSHDVSFDEELKIITNDAVVPIKVIRVLAQRSRPLEASKKLIQFNNVPSTLAVSEEIVLFSFDPPTVQALTITEESNQRLFSAKIDKQSIGTASVPVTITFAPPEDLGAGRHYFKETFLARGTLSDGSVCEVPIEAFAAVNK